ncbi:helix-turn-helix domain-containing protein [Haladaptatus pallidirubidus]|uniref:HTH bat-type domain-containing protein n=1 Tax=Haladaptatus pallidirubidus TaxID=1008152 RepID=A0AAV3UR33_9EURY|nr:helix-turn-helix domain-containing protein [Haladaptatus pallidirubidus]
MAHLRLKLNAAAVEDWLATLSTNLPDTIFNVSATIPTNEGLLGIVEVRTPDGERLVNNIEKISEVESCELLYMDDQRVLFQFTSRMTESYDVLISSGTVPQYPVSLHDGWYSAQLTASQEQLSEYLDELSRVGIPYEIVSLTHSYNPNEVLTERQWQAITEAVERGYYEAVRRCTLAELAETFDINESSMSKLLRRAENRIVTGFVAEASL